MDVSGVYGIEKNTNRHHIRREGGRLYKGLQFRLKCWVLSSWITNHLRNSTKTKEPRKNSFLYNYLLYIYTFLLPTNSNKDFLVRHLPAQKSQFLAVRPKDRPTVKQTQTKQNKKNGLLRDHIRHVLPRPHRRPRSKERARQKIFVPGLFCKPHSQTVRGGRTRQQRQRQRRQIPFAFF